MDDHFLKHFLAKHGLVMFGVAALFLTTVPWRDRFRPLTWGVIFPSVFDQSGTLCFNPFTLSRLSALGTDFLIFALALAGWRRMPRRTLPFLALIGFNAMPGFLIFR